MPADPDFAAALAADRDRTLATIAALTGDLRSILDGDPATDDEHDPEGATIAFERAQVSALLAAAREHLADLDRAAARLTAGAYGRCERCGNPIAAERLAALPAAATCIGCALRTGPRGAPRPG
jgi:DnaK suppressor protein